MFCYLFHATCIDLQIFYWFIWKTDKRDAHDLLCIPFWEVLLLNKTSDIQTQKWM